MPRTSSHINVAAAGNPAVVQFASPENASTSQVPASATTVTLAASNPDRYSILIHNDSSSTLYVKLGTAASQTDYSIQLGTQASYELQYPAYTGIITGIWDAANGEALVTEVTP